MARRDPLAHVAAELHDAAKLAGDLGSQAADRLVDAGWYETGFVLKCLAEAIRRSTVIITIRRREGPR